jgi:hypothetical protein
MGNTKQLDRESEAIMLAALEWHPMDRESEAIMLAALEWHPIPVPMEKAMPRIEQLLSLPEDEYKQERARIIGNARQTARLNLN